MGGLLWAWRFPYSLGSEQPCSLPLEEVSVFSHLGNEGRRDHIVFGLGSCLLGWLDTRW